MRGRGEPTRSGDQDQPVSEVEKARDWWKWHEPYDEPTSPLARRLAVVQRQIRESLDGREGSPIQVISLCAGQGRDLLGVLAEHPRRREVRGRLVEADPRNARAAARRLDELGLGEIELVCGDASMSDAVAGAVPADLILVCGVFGNISDDDVHATIAALPMMCAAGADVIWTRHTRPPDLTPTIRSWFDEAGFAEVTFDTGTDARFGVGTCRLRRDPAVFEPGTRLFSFVR